MDVKEESFKVCGLCSQLVDESVQLDPVFRAFLVSFLDIANENLPSKVCTDCYQQSFDCKKFKDRCDRAIRKLANTKLSDTMILGRSAVDKRTIEVSFAYCLKSLDSGFFSFFFGCPPSDGSMRG